MLQILWLYSNQLTGTIPATVSAASHLQQLDITANRIFGTIPASLLANAGVTNLHLSKGPLRTPVI